MRKIITGTSIGIFALFFCGCNHNIVNYGDGLGFDAGINPNSGMLSVNLRYGKILSAVVRDNTEIELTGKTAANGSITSEDSQLVNADTTLKVKINCFAKSDNKY